MRRSLRGSATIVLLLVLTSSAAPGAEPAAQNGSGFARGDPEGVNRLGYRAGTADGISEENPPGGRSEISNGFMGGAQRAKRAKPCWPIFGRLVRSSSTREGTRRPAADVPGPRGVGPSLRLSARARPGRRGPQARASGEGGLVGETSRACRRDRALSAPSRSRVPRPGRQFLRSHAGRAPFCELRQPRPRRNPRARSRPTPPSPTPGSARPAPARSSSRTPITRSRTPIARMKASARGSSSTIPYCWKDLRGATSATAPIPISKSATSAATANPIMPGTRSTCRSDLSAASVRRAGDLQVGAQRARGQRVVESRPSRAHHHHAQQRISNGFHTEAGFNRSLTTPTTWGRGPGPPG